MQAPVPGRTHMVKLFKGMSEMLAAVVAGSKGNIRNMHGAVAEKKSGLFHSLAVDVGVDGTAIFFCKKRLQVRFIDSGTGGNVRNAQILQIMFIYIMKRFFQINTSLGGLTGMGTESKLIEHAAEKEEEEEFFHLLLAGAVL